MRVLVIGSGGREHAILWALRQTSGTTLDLYSAPGNGGISDIAECVSINVTDHSGLMKFAHDNRIDLTIVGPEGPLAAGIVDEFENSGLRIMGPSRAASRLESSKAFAKAFMSRHQIPTAEYSIASSASEAIETLRSGRFGPGDAPVVVKADGLAAGKGVVVATSRAEAEKAVAEITGGSLVAREASLQIVLEEALQGREVSVLLFADGNDYALMPPARDHKRIGENDSGPNTGGMGAITDPSVLDSDTLNRIVSEVVEPTLRGAREEGFPFRGILFIGLMLTADGPKVLEYNVRFGDPETQAILVRLKSSLLEIFDAIVEGNLGKVNVEWTGQSSACVVLASGGYPGSYQSGIAINGLKKAPPSADLQIFHAGTSKSSTGDFKTAGGRVLGVTAVSPTLQQALDRCYQTIEAISWPGMQYRRDIGRFGLKASSSEFNL
ncbi:MAG TPA: phosphoribosylamine--glycine ligase [Pyrinomonadaceae bacterium]|nr:phosphoribosylamine--glycine ligase [Pyrinomonadaceae bacterium]